MRMIFRGTGTSRVLLSIPLIAIVASCGGGSDAAPPLPPDVGVTKPIRRDVTVFSEHLGTTEAYESVEVRARVTGELEQITFVPSTSVNERDVLFVIEPRFYKAERDAADAALKSALADLARAESDLQRVEQAIKTNAVSQSDVDLARASRDMARAQVLSAEAALDSAELQYSYTQVRAPISGQVGRNRVDRGNIVSGSERTLLTTVKRIVPMYVYFDAPEETVLRALRDLDMTTSVPDNRAEGKQLVEAQVATLIDEGFPFKGPIDYVSNTVDPDTGTIRLRAVLDNENVSLFPGLFVRVRIPVGEVEDAVLINEKALGTDLGGRYVYAVGADNIVEQRYVTLGVVEPDGMVPVFEGLEGNETYIVDGLLRARVGMPVTPREPSTESAPGKAASKRAATPQPEEEGDEAGTTETEDSPGEDG